MAETKEANAVKRSRSISQRDKIVKKSTSLGTYGWEVDR